MTLYILVALLSIWMLAITFAVVSLVRHVATMELARGGLQPIIPEFDLESDGPSIGTPLPDGALAIIEKHGGHRDGPMAANVLMFFLSPGCGTCLEVARKLAQREELHGRVIVFVLGFSRASTGASSDIITALGPIGPEAILDEPARSVYRSLDLHTMPFAVAAHEGKVSASRFLRRIERLDEFLDAARAAHTTSRKAEMA